MVISTLAVASDHPSIIIIGLLRLFTRRMPMPAIRCPGCGRTELVDLDGRFVLGCDPCQTEFVAGIVRHEPSPTVGGVCPQCGNSECLPLRGPAKLLIRSSRCNHQFAFPRPDSTEPSAAVYLL